MRGCGWRFILPVLVITVSATTAIGQSQPKKFCDCPDHQRPPNAASVSSGARYRLYGYNDAFSPSSTAPWCYTRAVWFERVYDSGRFEWQSSDKREVLAGAIRESADPCGSYHNHYESAAGPATQPSTIDHGPVLESSTDIILHYVEGEEFNPTWPARLKRRISSLVGFAMLTPSAPPTRVAVRVKSTVLGNAPQYILKYEIESSTGTSLNLHEFGQGSAPEEQFPRLYWEAAISSEFYDEMRKQKSGFLEGGAPIAIQIDNVQGVEPAIGRLLILPAHTPPPPPDRPAKDAILVGTASAFRAVPLPAPPGNLRVR